MILQFCLYACHAPFFPAAFEDEIVSCAYEYKEHRDPYRRNDDRFDKARTIRNRCDIAKPGGGDRNHRKIYDIQKADYAVMRVFQAFAVNPVDQDYEPD